MALLAGAALTWPAIREAIRQPERFGKTLVLAVMPESSLVMAFTGAMLLLGPEARPLSSLTPLWMLGGASAIVIAIQAILLRNGLPEAVEAPKAFGTFLVRYAVPFALSVVGLVAAIVLAG